MSSYLVTGASRGIGLEFTRQLSQLHPSKISKVFALTRAQPAQDLSQIINSSSGRVVHIPCDVTAPSSVAEALTLVQAELGAAGLDVLVNNVGIQKAAPGGICSMTDADLMEEFSVNVLAVHRMVTAFRPLLQKGNEKKIVNMYAKLWASASPAHRARLQKDQKLTCVFRRSTSLASMAHAARFMIAPTPGYKVTKAALNMLTVQYALEFEKDGFTVVALSPGVSQPQWRGEYSLTSMQWIKTDLGSEYADLEVRPGVQAALQRVLGINTKMNGHFLNIHMLGWESKEGPNQYDGGELPW
ncbi:MAG: hypothetical protein M1828_002349 [Chrysothrix sp. TS-e1954]|nr:MAG: hypothetical protein M1828_002349 [Chrysothrix sp. TS-e1954]